MKEKYINKIIEKINECADLALLDLILRILGEDIE